MERGPNILLGRDDKNLDSVENAEIGQIDVKSKKFWVGLKIVVNLPNEGG